MRSSSQTPWLRALAGVGLGCVLCFARPAAAEISTNATYDELLYAATRYGNTEARRVEKEAARAELFRRGPEALREVVGRLAMENVMLHVLALELVRGHVAAADGTPILLAYANGGEAEVRRSAVFLLGFYPAPENPACILPWLGEEKTRNAALRTAGAWKMDGAREEMRRLLGESDKERTRVLAANGLRDIGNKEDLPALIAALGDPVFTVRNTAARAVASFGRAAHRPLLQALPRSEGAARRQIVRLLGELRVPSAVRPLRRLLASEDPGLRADAGRALRQLGKEVAAGRVDSEPLFVAP